MGIFGVVSQSVLCDRLFDCFDSSSRGSINFEEYSASLETMTKGAVNEKLEFAFKMMDSGGKGRIVVEDLRVMLQSVINVYYGMLGQPTRQVEPREVARVFRKVCILFFQSIMTRLCTYFLYIIIIIISLTSPATVVLA